jgi:hypothetical protein
MKQHTIQIATALALLSSSAVHAQQALQWTVSDGGNGHWYGAEYQFRLWADAKLHAESIGGHLATTTSQPELDALRPLINNSSGADYWLGASRSTNGYPWVWVTGEPFIFTRWAPGEPDNGPESICLEVIGQPESANFNLWNDETYYAWGGGNYSIIEWDADCNADGIADYGQCHDGTLPDYNGNNIPDCCERGETCVTGNYPVQWKVSDGGNGHWYLFDQAVMHWQPHRDRAAAVGGHLGTVTSASEQTFVESVLFIQEADIWLGGVSNWPQPVAWITGEPVSFTYWQRYNPGGGYAFEMCGRPDCLLRFGWNIESENSDGWPGNKGLYEWDADCNNDNIVDYGQILQGQLADANTNGIPDICEGPTCHDIDLNLNGIVDGGDLGILLAFWGIVSPAFPRADINGDGLVNGADLGIVLASWGPCPN